MKPATVLINGQSSESSQNGLDPRDRGLHYGDGVFRTLRVNAGLPAALEWYFEYLEADCARLDIPSPARSAWQDDIDRLYADNADGVLKLMVTRGIGGRGYAAQDCGPATRMALRYPLPPEPAAGLRVTMAAMRLGRCRALAGIKHLNRLEQVLAARERTAGGYDELLMQDEQGELISGGMSNVFLLCNGEWLTPGLEYCGVKGVTRGRIIELARQRGIRIHPVATPADMLGRATAIFLSNSIMGARSVIGIDDRAYPEHPLVSQLNKALNATC